MLATMEGKDLDSLVNDSLAKATKLEESQQGLSSFFQKLESLERTKQGKIRIGYYGDSMTDGDLIVQDLRALFQEAFGGYGIGFLPIASESAMSRGSVIHRYSPTWKTQSYVNVKRPWRPFGVSGQVFFAQNPRGTWVQYKASNQPHISMLYTPTLYYGSSGNKAAMVEISYGDTLKVVKPMPTDRLLNRLVLAEGSVKMVRVNFIKADSIPIYGVNSDSAEGVYVDNFSSRGNSGLPLSLFNVDLMRDFDRTLSYDLIVLHFGANVLGYGSLDYSFYERGMTKVVNQLRACFPNTSILIISTADKSTKVDMEMKTDKAVVPLANAQRKYAKDTHSGFINLYELMGGEGSMKQWVEASPSLAGKDYTHFNARGAKKVAHLLYNQLMEDYHQYKNASKKRKVTPEVPAVQTATPTSTPQVTTPTRESAPSASAPQRVNTPAGSVRQRVNTPPAGVPQRASAPATSAPQRTTVPAAPRPATTSKTNVATSSATISNKPKEDSIKQHKDSLRK
jgi:hypothetical protein